MTTESTQEVSSIEQTYQRPSIERGRFRRAVIESFDVEHETDRLYRVTHGGESYHVDVENGGCTCPDAEYKGEKFYCKHLIKAALVEAFANTVSTELVARTVRFAREHGCPCGGFDCDGPCGPRLPCPGCIDCVRSESPLVDEWVVWVKAVSEGRR
jgi:hypothetical protein